MSNTTITINDRIPIPAGDHPMGLRVVVIYGVCPTIFGGNGVDSNLPRATFQWVVQLPDGGLGSMCHLVTLDSTPRSLVRNLAAALLNDATLRDAGDCPNAGILLGRSCVATVRRQSCGGRDRPVLVSAKPLPAGVAPLDVPEMTLWTPRDEPTLLPASFPQRYRDYANVAARRHYEQQQKRKGTNDECQ